MKKTYLQPETEILHLRNIEMIALSISDTFADKSDVLVKENNDWDIWGNDDIDDEE